jgi:xylulokinase
MYLGLDIGTSSVKAVLVDHDGRVLGVSSRPLAWSQPKPLWSEQDPELWIEAAIGAIDDLANERPSEVAQVSGLGLSGQMHGAVLIDAEGKPLRPAILWNDGRAFAECDELEARFPALREVSGNMAMPGFTAPKLLWVSRYEPQIFARAAKVLLPKAYVRFRLTGEMIEEMSDASGTLWLDSGRRRWSEDALEATHLEISNMPQLVEGSDACGFLAPELARRWGMGSRVVVAGGAGDCAASALGLGAIKPGDAFLSLGTSGVLFAVTGRFLPNPASAVHAFCHALPNLWHQMGVMLSAASALSWLAGILGTPESELLAPLGNVVRGPSPVQFLPYLAGERTPHNDSQATGALTGLRMATERGDIVQAVLEGVAYSAKDNLAVLTSAGTKIDEVDFAGGGSRSALWAQILADVLGIAVHRVEDGEVGAALGAARLGHLAATGDSPADVCHKPRRLATFEPRLNVTAAYHDAYTGWRGLYPALKEGIR